MSRIVLAAVAASLLAAPAPAAVAKPKPKPPPLCVTFTDPASDSGPSGTVVTNDPALDVTKVRLATVDKALVTQITVAKFGERALFGTGTRFQVTFTVAEKVVDVYFKTGPAREYERNAYYQQGVRVDGEFVHDAVTGSVSGDTVSIAVKLTMLKSAVGKKVEGVRATDVGITTYSSYVAQNLVWDRAPGPASGFVVGAACR